MEKDPICGMEVDPRTARFTAVHGGTTYYFCTPGCRKTFEQELGKYLDPNYCPSME